MKNILIKTKKIAVVLIIIGLNWTGLSAVGYTFAFYNDIEIANGNLLVAGQLDFVLEQSAWALPGGELDLDAGESISQDITVVDVDDKSIDFKYFVRPEKTGGDDDFCNALLLDASLEGSRLVYTGALFDFVSATTTFATSTDTWSFDVSLPIAAPDFDGVICEFDFIYSGWQIEFPNEGEGFNDIERVSNTIESGSPFNPAECPFEEGPGKTVVEFGEGIGASGDEALATAGPVFNFVPAGTYDITLASYDNHSGHGGQGQPEEQWYLKLGNLYGSIFTITSSINDLPEDDDQIIQKVETGFVLNEDAFFATAFHTAYPDDNYNSITPLCALFEGPNAGKELAPPEDLVGAPAGRASEGLLALSTFEEKDADEGIVWDVSGVGEPLNLLIGDNSATNKVSGGLSVDAPTIIKELTPSIKLINGVQATGELTIEAWVAPENTTQDGPARIATYSKDTGKRNFTLGQSSDKFKTRLRTTDTTLNGIPSLDTLSGVVTTNLTHIVYTRDASGNAKTFIDGALATSTTVSGSVSNWDSSYKFALANEITMDRAWLGALHLVAIYNKALSASEVLQNFTAGADRTVVLNEFLPNPLGTGTDGDLKPGGEWVELYNLSDTAIDVAGWYLYDSLDIHPLPINAGNSDNNGDTGDAGETIVPAHSYLVVYLDGLYSSGWLNNSGADSVRLYNGPIGTGVLVDSYSYDGRDNSALSPTPGDENVDDSSGGSGNSIPDNKSYARIPDGVGEFVDPIPTPLAPNKIDDPQSSSEQEGGDDIIEEIAVIKEEMIEPEEMPKVAISGGSDDDTPPDDEPVVEEVVTEEEEEIVIEEIPVIEEEIVEEIIEEISVEEEVIVEETLVAEEEIVVIEELNVIEEDVLEVVIIEEDIQSEDAPEIVEELIEEELIIIEPIVEPEPEIVLEPVQENIEIIEIE